MARPRLSEEERLARKKARIAFTFSDAAYDHFDPKKEGYGSIDEWIAIADILFCGGRGTIKMTKKSKHDVYLEILMLETLPNDIRCLKKAYRNALMVHHPDHGGSNETCIAVMKAFEELSKLY